MALKFSFNKLRTAVSGFLGGTNSSGSSLAVGEESIYVPRMRSAAIIEVCNAARTLTAEDSGKCFVISDSSAAAFTITLPPIATAEEGMWFRFAITESTLAEVVTIAAGSTIIAGPFKDAGGDVGAGTAGTEVSNLVWGTSAEIGDNVELLFVGGYYVIMSGGSSISGALTTT